MLAPYALNYGKRWYHITASFAFGQDILRSSRELLKQAGGTEVGVDEVPLNTADFSSFILKIRQAKPDVVVGGLSAGDLSTFLKQWNELGMRGKIPFVEIAIGDTDIWAVGPDAATGTFTKMWYYKNPNNPPEEKAFAAAYEKKYGKPRRRQGVDGLDHRPVGVRIDRCGEIHRSDGHHRGRWRRGRCRPGPRPTATASSTTRCWCGTSPSR